MKNNNENLMHIELIDGNYVDIDTHCRIFHLGKPVLWTDEPVLEIFNKVSEYIDCDGNILIAPNWIDDCCAPDIWSTTSCNLASRIIKYTTMADFYMENCNGFVFLISPKLNNVITLKARINGNTYRADVNLDDEIITLRRGNVGYEYIFPSLVDELYANLLIEFLTLIKSHKYSTDWNFVCCMKYTMSPISDSDDDFCIESYRTDILAQWEYLVFVYESIINTILMKW